LEVILKGIKVDFLLDHRHATKDSYIRQSKIILHSGMKTYKNIKIINQFKKILLRFVTFIADNK